MYRALVKEVGRKPLLWLLIFVPAAFVAAKLRPEAHTLLFVLSVLAIVPLAVLLSQATHAVAAKTGDAAGGLLNATLGNLTELVIALTALRAGDHLLVKASIAGAIVTNTLFMLGMSLLLGGLKHHVQQFNRASARFQAALLFLGTVALLIPSFARDGGSPAAATYVQTLSLALAILLIAAYGLGMLFSLGTHRELFASEEHVAGEAPWPMALALGTLVGVTVLVALVAEIFVESVQSAAVAIRNDARVRRFCHRRACGRRRRDGLRFLRGEAKPARPQHRHRIGQRVANRAVRRAGACAHQLRHRAVPDGPATLAGSGGHDADRDLDRLHRRKRRTVGVVRRRVGLERLSGLRNRLISLAPQASVSAEPSATGKNDQLTEGYSEPSAAS